MSEISPLRLWAYRRYMKVASPFLREVALWKIATRERSLLQAARKSYADQYLNLPEPLISVTIATYNRGQLLAERTIPTILAQTYRQFEVVIVGDGCTDDTEERLNALGESRIRFINLPERGKYPEDQFQRWLVAGTYPMNRALSEVRGQWVAHMDDDDTWEPEHLATLLQFAQQQHLELAYGEMSFERSQGEWVSHNSRFYAFGGSYVAHSSTLFRSYLTCFKYDPEAWRLQIGGDNHLFSRMARAGVKAKFLNRITAKAPLRPGVTRNGGQAEDRATL